MSLHEIDIFPFWWNVLSDGERVGEASTGVYMSGHFLSNAYWTFEMPRSNLNVSVVLGHAYQMRGRAENGETVWTHWMYCTKVGQTLRFGIMEDLRRPHVFLPVVAPLDDLLSEHAELSDISAIFPPNPPSRMEMFVPLGKTGALVTVNLPLENPVGILVRNAHISRAVSQGQPHITLSARNPDTLQTFHLSNMTCAHIGHHSIFVCESAP